MKKCWIIFIIVVVTFICIRIANSNEPEYITTPNGTKVEVSEGCKEYNSNVQFATVVDYEKESETLTMYDGYSNIQYKTSTSYEQNQEVCIIFNKKGDIDHIEIVNEENIDWD